MENGTCRTGGTRKTINQTIRRIYHCPDPHLPLLLNSSNHQSHLSHMSHSSHYSNSGAEHTPNSSIHQLTFKPFGRFSASKTRLYQRSFIAFTIQPTSLAPHRLKFNAPYYTLPASIWQIHIITPFNESVLFSSFHCPVADVKIVKFIKMLRLAFQHLDIPSPSVKAIVYWSASTI